MTTEDLDIIKEAVRNEIRITVNGKVDAISEKLDAHVAAMAPIKDALNWVNTTQRFIKWTGIPILVFFGWVLGWFK